MEYIECTHCEKRYAVNSQIKASEGEFAKCKSCHDKFLIVIHDSEKIEANQPDEDEFDATIGWNPTLTVPPTATGENASSDWNPSLTMPDEDEVFSGEPSLDEEETKKKAAATLATIQKEKKEKQLTYVVLVMIVALLLLILSMTLMQDESRLNEMAAQAPIVKRLSASEIDEKNPLCREAAAKQWLIDYRAMHSKYSGENFVKILQQSDAQAALVKSECKSRLLLKSIIQAATVKEKPGWFASEIKALQ